MKKYVKGQYKDYVKYVSGIFSLGGLSECGKSSAGNHFEKLGILKMKIIHIEKEMMVDRGFDLSNGMKDEHFIMLYAENQELVFEEFLFRLIIKMHEMRKKYCSIESLYRAPLGKFLKKALGNRMVNIYIDAPVEVRATREMVKINDKKNELELPNLTLDEVINIVNEKDLFKVRHKATDVKEISDYIIYNDESLTYENFLKTIENIAKSLGVKITNNEKKTDL